MANTSLWLEVLSPSHPQFCDPCLLKPLFDYMLTVPIIKKDFDERHIDVNNFASECKVFKNTILRNFKPNENHDIGDIYQFIRGKHEITSTLFTSLYKLCMTCEYASPRVECLFSAMAYVDTPRRCKSKSARECALTHLLFEKETVRHITFDEFSQEWLKKPRCLFF